MKKYLLSAILIAFSLITFSQVTLKPGESITVSAEPHNPTVCDIIIYDTAYIFKTVYDTVIIYDTVTEPPIIEPKVLYQNDFENTTISGVNLIGWEALVNNPIVDQFQFNNSGGTAYAFQQIRQDPDFIKQEAQVFI